MMQMPAAMVQAVAPMPQQQVARDVTDGNDDEPVDPKEDAGEDVAQEKPKKKKKEKG